MISDGKPILDACCGSRMFWFDKDNPFVEFMDIRDEDVYLSDGQLVMVHPNTIGPPHLVWAGKAANFYKRYGKLDKDWQTELAMGFKECFRVLEPYGVLIFKWAEIQLKLHTVLALTNEKPLFGHKRGKTFWVAFMKFPKH